MAKQSGAANTSENGHQLRCLAIATWLVPFATLYQTFLTDFTSFSRQGYLPGQSFTRRPKPKLAHLNCLSPLQRYHSQIGVEAGCSALVFVVRVPAPTGKVTLD